MRKRWPLRVGRVERDRRAGREDGAGRLSRRCRRRAGAARRRASRSRRNRRPARPRATAGGSAANSSRSSRCIWSSTRSSIRAPFRLIEPCSVGVSMRTRGRLASTTLRSRIAAGLSAVGIGGRAWADGLRLAVLDLGHRRVGGGEELALQQRPAEQDQRRDHREQHEILVVVRSRASSRSRQGTGSWPCPPQDGSARSASPPASPLAAP